MSLRVVGAGLGRTGTNSLMVALEQLLGAPCYHMYQCFVRDDAQKWLDIGRGDKALLHEVVADCAAAVDWPASAYWEELAAANPDAIILLSTRTSGEAWFKSANDTIFPAMSRADGPWREMVDELFANTFTPDVLDKDKAIAAYDAHNAHVRAIADPKRLLDWQASDGWEPICAALGLPVPDNEFPHTNSTEDFLNRRFEAD
ncbi:MAG: sulfotransferase family protein [Actinobacteria bacterium]|nr:sulfotransferase family protein [Actinomycetota bacterium]